MLGRSFWFLVLVSFCLFVFLVGLRDCMGEKLTTVRVPTISRGGSMLLSTSWLTKWAVMPTMAIIATMLRPRAIRKVFASGAEVAILLLVGFLFGALVVVCFS